jgi:hypothetical protein
MKLDNITGGDKFSKYLGIFVSFKKIIIII